MVSFPCACMQVILLADILPTLIIKAIFPWFMHVIPYWSVKYTGNVSCLGTPVYRVVSSPNWGTMEHSTRTITKQKDVLAFVS